MSTDTSVPQPRVSGLDVSDSALLATLLREAPIGFAFFGPDLRVRRINQTLARLDGLDLEAHLGLLPSQVWPGTLASRVESAVRHVLADGQPLYESNQPVGETGSAAPQPAGPQSASPHSASLQSVSPQSASTGQPGLGDGASGRDEDRQWAFSWFPSHDPDGNVAGVALIAVDVTDRQNSAEAVRRSEERYRSLVQAGAQVVWVTTPTGQIAEDSPEWRWITGQSLEEYLGNGWLDAIHPEDRSGWSGNGASASRPARCSTAGTGCAPRPAPTGTTTCARCRS